MAQMAMMRPNFMPSKSELGELVEPRGGRPFAGPEVEDQRSATGWAGP